MPPAGFETVIPGSLRPQAHYLYSAVTGIGTQNDIINRIALFVLESINTSVSATTDVTPHIWALHKWTRLSDFSTGGSIAPL